MFQKLILFSLVFFSLISCKDTDPTVDAGSNDDFERGALLMNIADNIVIPAYTDLDSKLSQLKADKDLFIANPTTESLAQFRASWLLAYKAWQHVEMFNIGKAEVIMYNFQMNTYPTNISDITTNINATTVDLTSTNNNDAVGFPAVEYLLYGFDQSDVLILEKYTTDANAVKNKKYISDITNQMHTLTQTVFNDWKNSYRNTFVSSTSNTITSSLNKFINDYIQYAEKDFRAGKIGFPTGIFSGESLPHFVEGYYSKVYSKELAIEGFKAIKNIYYGTHFNSGVVGVGLVDYLKHLNKIEVVEAIQEIFTNINTKLNGLSSNFVDQIANNKTQMTETYDAIQKIVVKFKVDMVQSFGIRIDYADSDGD